MAYLELLTFDLVAGAFRLEMVRSELESVPLHASIEEIFFFFIFFFPPVPGRSVEVFRAGCVGGAKALAKKDAVQLCCNPGLGCGAAVARWHIRVTPLGSQGPPWAGLAIGKSFI